MEITILGSGGFQTIPRPTCQCGICKEARKKGTPCSRKGPAIYIKELDTIFDTPKDIVNSINQEGIKKINNIFYTHWHPDHTEGMRVVEEITSNWTKKHPFILKNNFEPISVFIPDFIKNDFLKLRSPKSSYFDFFVFKNFIKLKFISKNKPVKIKDVAIAYKKINSETSCYVIKNKTKKLVYLPCDVKPFETYDFLENTDLFIVGSPFLENKNGLGKIPLDHPLRKELFSLDEIIDLIKKFNIKKTIITHIEEMWGLSYTDYKILEKKLTPYKIKFSFDGMKLKL